MQYQTIVLAYDGTVEGRRALVEGAALAKRCGATAHLLAVVKHTASSAIGQGFEPGLPDSQADFYQTTLDEGVRFLKQHGLDSVGHLVHGDPVEEILKLAKQVRADLVVLGHRNRGPLARWWSTPTSMSLIDELECSVLIGMHDSGKAELAFPEK
jgi:nucleotide-binding universal stress UspA family protein